MKKYLSDLLFENLSHLDPYSLLIGALTVLFGVITFLSFLFMIYYQRVNKKLYRQRYTYSWDDILQGVHKLYNYSRIRIFNPDVIVSFSGAAGVVANLFLLLTEKRLPFYQVLISEFSKPWDNEPKGFIKIKTSRHTIYIPEALSEVDKKKRIIIIDAVCRKKDWGSGLVSCKNELKPIKLVYGKSDKDRI